MKGGEFELRIYDCNGRLKEIRRSHNTMTTNGINYIADRWRNRSNVKELSTGSGWIAVGCGSGPISAADITLGSEVCWASGGRMKCSSVSRGTTSTQLVCAANFSTSGAIWPTINETGIFVTGYDTTDTLQVADSGPDTGLMICRATFADVNKTGSDTMSVIWKLNMT